MSQKRRKRKIKVGRIIAAIVILILLLTGLAIGIYFLVNKSKELIVNRTDMYLASDSTTVELYKENEEGILELSEELIRGTKVVSLNKEIEKEEKKYSEIEYEENIYYVISDNLSNNEKDVVLEDTKYVRTSVTVYENEIDSAIDSFIKKGNELEITGYDELLENGEVNMYKIKSDDIEGWVYSKYLVDDYDSAIDNYNENSVYDTHKDRKFSGREL